METDKKNKDEIRRPLLLSETASDTFSDNVVNGRGDYDDDDEEGNGNLNARIWIETKKLWHIVGPSIFSRVASFTMNVVTQAFAGHLGEVELAAISISNTVIVGLNFGLLVSSTPAKYKTIHVQFLYFFLGNIK
nr:protein DETOXIFICATION 27-like [Ipomoea batatas]